MRTIRIVGLVMLAPACLAAAPLRFTAPMQPWTSRDGAVRLLRPAAAPLTTSVAAVNTLMRPGWRLVWGDTRQTPGRMIARIAIPVKPKGMPGTAAEVFQVGASRDPYAVRTCLRHGLDSGSGNRRPDRMINGVRFGVWTNADAGMSQRISGTDLRAIVDGACYAVERYAVGEAASDGDPTVTLPEADGAALLDATLASLRIAHRPGRQ
jgi:hypothetical protein